jgi:hypothetical protein
MATDPNAAATAGDPLWLAHRYDPVGDAVHFVRATRDDHRAATFLTDEYLPAAATPRPIRRQAALAAAGRPAPIHFVFHSAYCCSTLLARAFDIEGVSMGLKEPVILNDLIGWKHRGGEPARIAEVLDGTLRLLARPFAPGEATIVKPSNLINSFAAGMLAMRPDARALLLYAPLRLYLGSIAKKGMWGRLWVRELFVKLARDGLVDYGFSGEEVMQQTDLQIAAIGWLAQHRLFQVLVDRYGPARVRTLDSETLLARPADAIGALAQFYGLSLDAAAIGRVVDGDAFTTHSKGTGAFDREARIAEQRDAAAVHAEEVDKVAIWAEAVATSARQPLDLTAPLLG